MPQDLKTALDSTPQVEFTEEHIIIILYNILCGLKYLHKGNIIHRDIKPANILIDENCRVRFCDFGLARTLHSKSDADAPRYSREQEFKKEMAVYLQGKTEKERDMTCCVMTRIYRPPEVILTHNDYGKPADIWSLGVVLAEMMACSSVYSREKNFCSSNRFLFLGKACFPISPHANSAEDITKEDQLIKILERFPNNDVDLDTSFLINKEERDYHNQAKKIA